MKNILNIFKIKNFSLNEIDSKTRSSNIKHQIKLSFLFRFMAILTNFFLVRLVFNYFDLEHYGIWMTIMSVLSWFTFFDFGLGNGMKNKVSESLSIGYDIDAKKYISTTYAVVAGIAIVFFVIILFSSPFFDFSKIFNTKLISNMELRMLFIVSAFFVLLNFVISLVNQLIDAHQMSSLTTLNQLVPNLLIILILIALSIYFKNNLIMYALIYGIILTISNILLSFLFYKQNRALLPSLSCVDISGSRQIISLSLQFFVLQIAVLIIFTTDNFIITQVLGPQYVAQYNIVYRLFSFITIIFGILVNPMWAAYTEAYAKKDFAWIRSIIRKLNMMMIPIIILTFLLVVFSKNIINFWIGKDLLISFKLVVFMGIFVIISAWNNIYALFVNGIGRIKPQLYSAIVAGIINIPLSIYFARNLHMGVAGVILATNISLSLFAVIGPIQTFRIIKDGETKNG